MDERKHDSVGDIMISITEESETTTKTSVTSMIGTNCHDGHYAFMYGVYDNTSVIADGLVV